MKRLILFLFALSFMGIVYAGTWSNDVRDVQVYGNGLVSTDMEQYQISQGNIYSVSEYNSLAAGTSYTYLIDLSTATNTKDINVRIGVASDQNLELYLTKDGTVVSSGTAITPYNMNDDYASVTPEPEFYYEPSAVSTGTIMATAYSIADSANVRFGGFNGRRTYWHLSDGTTYLFIVYNKTASAAVFNFWLEFIQEDN